MLIQAQCQYPALNAGYEHSRNIHYRQCDTAMLETKTFLETDQYVCKPLQMYLVPDHHSADNLPEFGLKGIVLQATGIS